MALGSTAFSPYLVEGIVRLGTEMAFERAPEVLSFFTQLGVGEETVRQLTEHAGATLVTLVEAEVEREPTEPRRGSGGGVLQVSADGAMVHLVKEGWAEVKTLAIGRVEVNLGGDVHAREMSYFSRLDNAQVFGRLAEGELRRRGVHAADTLCAVSDGAEWIQRLVDWRLPKAVRILDFPHAAEYVHAVAQAVFGPGTADASEWVGKWLHELRHGDPDAVLAELRTLDTAAATDPGVAAKVRDDTLAYLEKRRPLISYAEFTAAGLPIGSGMVESANKLVVEERLKGAGMHWARCNVNPLLALRNAACSHRWQETWPLIWKSWPSHRRQRRSAQPPVEPPSAPPTAAPTQPSVRPKREPAIKLEQKGMMKDGKPTADHPFNAGLRSRSQNSAH